MLVIVYLPVSALGVGPGVKALRFNREKQFGGTDLIVAIIAPPKASSSAGISFDIESTSCTREVLDRGIERPASSAALYVRARSQNIA